VVGDQLQQASDHMVFLANRGINRVSVGTVSKACSVDAQR
jgi:hypothetical protein